MSVHDDLRRITFSEGKLSHKAGPGGKQLTYVDTRHLQDALDTYAPGWTAYFDVWPSVDLVHHWEGTDDKGNTITNRVQAPGFFAVYAPPQVSCRCTLLVDGVQRQDVGQGADWFDASNQSFRKACCAHGLGRYLWIPGSSIPTRPEKEEPSLEDEAKHPSLRPAAKQAQAESEPNFYQEEPPPEDELPPLPPKVESEAIADLEELRKSFEVAMNDLQDAALLNWLDALRKLDKNSTDKDTGEWKPMSEAQYGFLTGKIDNDKNFLELDLKHDMLLYCLLSRVVDRTHRPGWRVAGSEYKGKTYEGLLWAMTDGSQSEYREMLDAAASVLVDVRDGFEVPF